MEKSTDSSILLVGKKYMSEIKSALLNMYTLGITYILCRISIKFEIFFKTSPCSLEEANCVVLKDQYNNMKIVKIIEKNIKPTLLLKRYARHRKIRILDVPYGRFIYDYQLSKFVLPRFNYARKSFEDIYQERLMKSKEEESTDVYEKQALFGKNDTCLVISSAVS
ncbi:uncharacterized protein VICG_01429, partial [Vittaforma corneae ATCC 50505]